jgi:hypothetical protein
MSSAFGRCTCCDKVGPLDVHHRFPQKKWALKLYGDLIHAPANQQLACSDCHASHRSTKLIHWSEAEFCEALGLEPRSKVGQIEKLGSCV